MIADPREQLLVYKILSQLEDLHLFLQSIASAAGGDGDGVAGVGDDDDGAEGGGDGMEGVAGDGDEEAAAGDGGGAAGDGDAVAAGTAAGGSSEARSKFRNVARRALRVEAAWLQTYSSFTYFVLITQRDQLLAFLNG